MVNERELVLDSLLEILEKKALSHLVIRDVLTKYDYLKPESKGFYKHLTEGTLERMITLDAVLDSASKVPVQKMKPLIRNLLRMSLYQLMYMDSIPDSAVCNEAVKLCGKRGFRNLQGFVNGVLRNLSRNKDNLPDLGKLSGAELLSVEYSMPLWLVNRFIKDIGEERALLFLKNWQKIRPITVRYAGEEAHKESWLQAVTEKGISISPHPYLSYAYEISGVEGITKVPGYEEGKFAVQDVAGMLVTQAIGLKGDEILVDVCAAPGGKSTHAASLLTKGGKVYSYDLSEGKCSLMKENARRLRLSNMIVSAHDATERIEDHVNAADAVICDLPCSGLGVISRKKDIPLKVTEEGIKELALLQKQILEVASQYVRKGGTLIYSTCTMTKEENAHIREWILEKLPFKEGDLKSFLPKALKEDEEGGALQLISGVHECDGFYIAKFTKV